jgi:hypothetical protein
MALEYRITPLPPVWPGKQTPSWNRKRAPFKAQWAKTTHILERELKYLGAKKIEIACEVRGDRTTSGRTACYAPMRALVPPSS